jgi:hypothetical protein
MHEMYFLNHPPDSKREFSAYFFKDFITSQLAAIVASISSSLCTVEIKAASN